MIQPALRQTLEILADPATHGVSCAVLCCVGHGRAENNASGGTGIVRDDGMMAQLVERGG